MSLHFAYLGKEESRSHVSNGREGHRNFPKTSWFDSILRYVQCKHGLGACLSKVCNSQILQEILEHQQSRRKMSQLSHALFLRWPSNFCHTLAFIRLRRGFSSSVSTSAAGLFFRGSYWDNQCLPYILAYQPQSAEVLTSPLMLVSGLWYNCLLNNVCSGVVTGDSRVLPEAKYPPVSNRLINPCVVFPSRSIAYQQSAHATL